MEAEAIVTRVLGTATVEAVLFPILAATLVVIAAVDSLVVQLVSVVPRSTVSLIGDNPRSVWERMHSSRSS